MYVPNGMFVEGLPGSIRNSVHFFWSIIKHNALQKLAYEATCVEKLQEEARGVDTPNSYRPPPTVIG